MISAASLARDLGQAKREVGGGWRCLCPAHKDHDPSLSVVEKNGKLLVTCRAGCDQLSVVDALRARGLWPNKAEADQSRYVAATYTYVDEGGRKLFDVLRWGPKKTFSQQQPGTGKGGIKRGPDGKPTMQGARYVPYHLDELVAAKARCNGHPWRVYLCEGEKDADRLREWGLVATTNAGGAKYWRPEYDACFAGSETILLEDNDQAGRERTAKLVPELLRAGAVVRAVRFPHLPEGGDISDWIDDGGSQGNLEDLVDSTTAETAAAATSQANPSDWPEPANFSELGQVPRFPVDFLPGALGEFAVQQAFDLQAPLDFVAIPLLIGAATLVGKEFRMAPKARANWSERACLWGACIGYVGDGKTPAFNAAFAPIWPLQEKWREEFHDKCKAHKIAVKRAKAIERQWEKDAAEALKNGAEPPPMPEAAVPPEAPVAREIITNDTTQERIAALLMDNPRGALLFRDELSGWFSSFNQYRPGADEQFYLQCHAGGPWMQHRKSGDVAIPDVFLAVFGGLQPDVVAAALARGVHAGKPDNGLTARLSLLAWPEAVCPQWVDNEPDRDLRDHVNRLFERISTLDPERFVGPRPQGWNHYPPLRFTPDGQVVFRDWFLAHHQAQDTIEPDAQIKGHFAKYDGLFARLALVRHLLRHAQGEPVEPACVGGDTAIAVRDFIEIYLRPHARKIYGHLANDAGYAGAKKIGQWLLDNPEITSFTAREISRKHWAGLTGKDETTGKDFLRAALRHLDNVAGWVREEELPTGGRPKIVYLVNPRVHQLRHPMPLGAGLSAPIAKVRVSAA